MQPGLPPVTIVNGSSMSASSGTTQSLKPRTLILCFDGTSDQYDSTNSNVVKLFGLFRKDMPERDQLCYYQAGVGTYFNPGAVSPLFQWGAKILDEAFAWYLDAHVREGYEFLMQTYRPGDRICLFGFSRGAYTARALGGMLHKIGLLLEDNLEQLPFAYQLYKKTDATSLALAAGFKQTFCRSVIIDFVGVWDTVASVGIILRKTLPFVSDNQTIRTFRQALSLDEHRARFRPDLYHRPPPGAQLDAPPEELSEIIPLSVEETRTRRKRNKLSALFSRNESKAIHDEEAVAVEEAATGMVQVSESEIVVTDAPAEDPASQDGPAVVTDALEVWFSGCHSDVGGGATANSVKQSLSDITLRWMVREVHQAKCGVAFDTEALANMNIPESIFDDDGEASPAAPTAERALAEVTDPSDAKEASAPSVRDDPASRSTTTPGQDHDTTEPKSHGPDCATMDAIDAVQPLHDELVLLPAWWLLEIIPSKYTWQDSTGKWHSTWSINLGRGRMIYQEKPLFHITVKERIEDKSLKYKPKAIWKPGSQVYIS